METEGMALAERHLEEFAEKYFQDRPRVKLLAVRGNPVEQIRKYVESEKIDMVIVANHDRFPLERAIFGNVAEQIARSSPVPVTVINPSTDEEKAQMPVGSPVAQQGLTVWFSGCLAESGKGNCRIQYVPSIGIRGAGFKGTRPPALTGWRVIIITENNVNMLNN
jgi:hypothetical protein